jgi:hypothetical protein
VRYPFSFPVSISFSISSYLSSRAKTDYPQVVPWEDVETSLIAVGT